VCSSCIAEAGFEAEEINEGKAAETGEEPDKSIPDPNPESLKTTVDEDADIPDVDLLKTEDIEYLGAFRLPGDGERPDTFDYGGGAITFNPGGDPDGKDDGFKGSLFIMGHPRLPYGELPDGNKVAEVSIPAPVIAESVESLNTADFIQEFSNIAEGFFASLNELPRTAMQYFEHPAGGASIHLAWGQHFQEEPQTSIPSHASFSADLSNPGLQGTWYIGSQSLYSTNNYLLDVPISWADDYLGGFYLATGRFRDGGWSGMGPALFAYSPWIDENSSFAEDGARLQERTLLLYENTFNTENIENCLNGYQHPDEWEGAAWITTASGKNAVLFAGTKGTGDKYWYGFINPEGPQEPCVEEEMVGQFTLCRQSGGSPCSQQDLDECAGHTSERGWWSSSFSAQFILYDPAELTRVAAGQIQPWKPQPYETISIDSNLFLNPSGIEPDMLGTGVQRRYRIGDITFDRANGLLYVLELFADDAKPVVHVWKME
ncbi:MAG: hypothetical protein JW770_06435, partial [Actinobacteria bacterium]|nr:hypothetical protein [Actinomycetota bacterium]